MAAKKKPEKKVKIKITDAFGIGYVAGQTVEVEPAEAAKLIEEKKAIPHTDKPENAANKNTGVETR